MAKTLRIATFNAENLFARFKFASNVDPLKAVKDGWLVDKTKFVIDDEPSKRITGQAIKATRADVIALQEIENLDTLKRFRSSYLTGASYPHVALIEGNDPRRIDVAVLSKLPIVKIRSYQHLRSGRSALFSRDCLEVDVEYKRGAVLTLYVNHLKSMMGGRAETRAKRLAQSAEVVDIVKARFGAKAGAHPFIVLGDLNDYLETDAQGKTGISALASWGQVENVIARLPAQEQWTHFWNKGNEYKQLDYILPSKSLASSLVGLPEIVRKGLPTRATRYTGPRFPGVGKNTPKASDHCPVVVEVRI
jgi:endonuclease/exonuclease/phosphatase family metal-dependent hydrolase